MTSLQIKILVTAMHFINMTSI